MNFGFLTKHLAEKYARRCRRFRRKGPEIQQLFNNHGVYFLPHNYYCPVPSAKEVSESFEYERDGLPWHDPVVFNRERMLAFLKELEPFAREFVPPQEGESGRPEESFSKNGFFQDADATAYYAVLRRFQPARVIEIGSGFSTLVAAQALARNGRGELICIEPYPRAVLREIKAVKELIEKPVQALSINWFNETLQDGDVLFIDSTHIVKTGSDCLHLYLKILPYLNAELLIHSHDIFLPEAMPQDWQLDRRFYFTEQYLLYALLLGNPGFEAVYGSNYHRRVNPAEFAAFNGPDSKPEGGSFWYRKLRR